MPDPNWQPNWQNSDFSSGCPTAVENGLGVSVLWGVSVCSVLLEGGAVLVQSSLKNLQLSSETSQTCLRNARKGAQEFF